MGFGVDGPVTCEQQDDICLDNQFSHLTLFMNERMTPPPLPAQSVHRLPSVSPHFMSQMRLGSFSLTHLEQHYARGTDTHEHASFVLKMASPVIPWVTYHVTTRHYARLALRPSGPN